MSGNVTEWCWDWKGSISDSSAADGATSGDDRVMRSGKWSFLGYICNVAFRDFNYGPDCRFDSFGFRVVRLSN